MSRFQMDDTSKSEHRLCFESNVTDFYRGRETSLKKPWTRERISQVMSHVKQFKISKLFPTHKSSKDYYYSKRYESIVIDNRRVLIRKRKTPDEAAVRIVPLDEYFDILYDCHLSIGHGGRDKMLHVLQTRYIIPKPIVEMFIKCCKQCNERKIKKKVATTTKNEVSSLIGQVDLIDMRAIPDNSYRWLLIYQQNRVTPISQLRPLETDDPREVAQELAKIFLTLGVPRAIRSELGNDFVKSLINELRSFLSDRLIVPEQLCDGETSSNVRRFDTLIRQWMRDNSSLNWSFGCHFIQFTVNSSFRNDQHTSNKQPDTNQASNPETLLMELNSDEILQEVFPEILTEDNFLNDLEGQQKIIQDACDEEYEAFGELFATEALELLEDEYDVCKDLFF